MTLLQQLTPDLVAAMKEKDAMRVGALRMLKAALANAEIAARGSGKAWDDAMAIATAQRHAKQLRESMAEYRAGNREDLAASAAAELAVVERYLPAQLADDDIRKAIADVRARTGASQMGALMGAVMKELQGKADGNTVRKLVEEALRG